MEKKIHLGYRYKLKISDGQKSFLDHHMFIYNQAYNICLNLWLKENEKNKNLPKISVKPLDLSMGSMSISSIV